MDSRANTNRNLGQVKCLPKESARRCAKDEEEFNLTFAAPSKGCTVKTHPIWFAAEDKQFSFMLKCENRPRALIKILRDVSFENYLIMFDSQTFCYWPSILQT